MAYARVLTRTANYELYGSNLWKTVQTELKDTILDTKFAS